MNADRSSEDGADGVIEVRNLSRRFGDKLALDHVSLRVEAGSVTGLVGRNGAGKTTLIRHVLGLLRAQSGTVRVHGKDPVADAAQVLAQVGYLSEEPDLPGWMRVGEFIRYVRTFYPAWDEQYADQLQREFALDAGAKLKALSKGQRARVGLLAALAYRPGLLVLDEPSSGLDPVVRRDILAAIIRTIAEEGRTVLFSSHLLSEVERVCDRVAMIEAGKVVFCDGIDEIKRSHRRVTLKFARARMRPPPLAGALCWEGGGQEWTALYRGTAQELCDEAADVGARVVAESAASLDEIFMARAAGDGVAASV
jgi:ABC-2 type transport system ATP-binding protein